MIGPMEDPTNARLDELEEDLDILWTLLCAFLVFMMQAGFSLLEAGTVRETGVTFILLKNVLDACLSGLLWYAVGYGFATGKNGGGFIGLTDFANSEDGKPGFFADWVYSWTFAASTSTIVSGAVAERCELKAYMIFTFFMTIFIYPTTVQWFWSESGWLSMYNRSNDGADLDSKISPALMDYAGSGVVHMVGGAAALVGAKIIGPREGNNFRENDIQGSSMTSAAVGTMLLWFGWYGFNGGSTGCFVTCMQTAGKIAINTTLAASSAGVCVVLIHMWGFHDMFVVSPILNGILGGLVSITAGCAMVEPFSAIIIGTIGGFVYYGFNKLLWNRRIDDPLGASAVHLACGIWGLVSVGLFATEAGVERAYDLEEAPGYGLLYGFTSKGINQLLIQILGALVIVAWSSVLSSIIFVVLNRMKMLARPGTVALPPAPGQPPADAPDPALEHPPGHPPSHPPGHPPVVQMGRMRK